MSRRDPHIIERINLRRVIVATVITLLLVLVVLFAFLMEDELPITLQSLAQLHRQHPSLFLIDALPLLVFFLLWPMHRIMNRAIRDYEKKVLASQEFLKRNTEFARTLSEGSDPEPYEDMMESDLGKVLRLLHLNIKSNRRKEKEQSWIAEGKDMVSLILRQKHDFHELSYEILKLLNGYIESIQGAFYVFDEEKKVLINTGTYAYNRRRYLDQQFRLGEGLVGQCAYEMDYIYRTEIPEEYISISSGILGEQKPESILLVPLITNEKLQGIIEFAFLKERIPKLSIQFLLELGDIIAQTLLNLKMNLRTQNLLEESRKMTEELQKNETQLQENARAMSAAQQKLESANIQLEKKMEEANQAQDRLRLMLEQASEIISIYDRDGILSYISPSVIQIFGFSVEEMMAGKDQERMGRQHAAQFHRALNYLREHPDETQALEYTFVKKSGERLYLRSLCRNMLDDSSIRGFLINTTDITESVKVEREQRLKTRMQSLSENSLDLILRISTSGTIHYVNPIVEDYTGISPASMVNRNKSEVPFREDFARILNEILAGMEQAPAKKNLVVNLPMSMGEYQIERILSMDAIPEYQEGELESILIVGHDITEAKRIEKEIKVQNRKVQDSINYAERIQSSILPEVSRIRKAFPKSFVYYQPRDVISGDFPWLFESEDSYYIAAVDCTGHGVPGALLSLVGHFLMNNICGIHPGIPAGELCDELHREVRKALRQEQERSETRDGMDLALCRFFKKEKRMEFAGAHRPLYVLSEGEVAVYKGNRKAIGGLKHPRKPEMPFSNQEISYQSGDKFFFFTDGLTDQMGGPDGLTYGSARFRQALLEHPGYTLSQFESFFRSEFNDWRGEERQLDDLLLIGIESLWT